MRKCSLDKYGGIVLIEVSDTGFRRLVGSCNVVVVKRGSILTEGLSDFKRDRVPSS
jgi:hypothetical protein